MEILGTAVLTICGTIGFVSLYLAYKFIKADRNIYNINRELTGGFVKVLKGKVSTFHEGHRDHRVQAGLAVNKSNNTWVEQGTLSHDSINCVLR